MKVFLGVILAVVVVALVWRLTRKEETAIGDLSPINATMMHNTVIKEVIQAASYTYLRVKEGKEELWIATAKDDVKVGDKFSFGEALEMTNFTSKELDRTFPVIYFVNDDGGMGGAPDGDMAAPASMGKPKVEQLTDAVIPQNEGGISIGELYKNRDKYANKTVRVKGKVVKINPEVMDRNWIHLQDGTSDAGSFDLTVTTLDLAVVDDIVEFEGTIILNKDFGAGYTYELIMESGVKQK